MNYKSPTKKPNTLLVLAGPTGVGKTELSLELAKTLNSPILSADSRQIYKGIEIGTAAPTPEQKKAVTHHFAGELSIDEYFSAAEFENQALNLLYKLFETHPTIVATGGSMMYLDALCYGIDKMPDVDPQIREQLFQQYQQEGLENILQQLKIWDPKHYNEVDKKNYKRVIHALEICLSTGKPYSTFRLNSVKQRPFNIVKIGLERDREDLYNRINKRVDDMIALGLVEEARSLFSKRHLNALNTVGYKEIFNYLEGTWTLDFAIEKIKQSTRIYARQQLRWFKKDTNTLWINISHTPYEDAKCMILERL